MSNLKEGDRVVTTKRLFVVGYTRGWMEPGSEGVVIGTSSVDQHYLIVKMDDVELPTYIRESNLGPIVRGKEAVMQFIKGHRSTIQTYTVVDGPVMDTEPGHRTQGKFKVDYLAVTWMENEVQRVYVKGQGLKADGTPGKYVRARTLFGSDIPDWVDEVLDISL